MGIGESYGPVVQLAERLVCIQDVGSSSLLCVHYCSHRIKVSSSDFLSDNPGSNPGGNIMNNYRNVRTRVSIRSSQTQRTYGEIVRSEYDHRYGEQFLIRTFHPDWGDEYFWMKENEIRVQR